MAKPEKSSAFKSFYTFTKPLFCYGENRFLDDLNPRGGETICEIGCGNCDNLIKLYKRNQNVILIGFDYPEERTKLASKIVKEKGLQKNIKIVCGLAHEYVFDEQIDRFIFLILYRLSPTEGSAH